MVHDLTRVARCDGLCEVFSLENINEKSLRQGIEGKVTSRAYAWGCFHDEEDVMYILTFFVDFSKHKWVLYFLKIRIWRLRIHGF